MSRDDDPEPIGHGPPQHEAERRHEHDRQRNLSDAGIEGHERGQEMLARVLQHFRNAIA
jgi:hypothetical protein